ncbi:hypothetical protein LCGC14_1355250 [marine sediment metagenome]|uniref:Uncharacterized protein n=1 Tax=marine sediment metagenome TaxID=412755 RepID=A0A0F9KVX0_9ZZZZ
MDKLIESLIAKVENAVKAEEAQVWANTLRTVCLAKEKK